jgi:hypothetical protein
MYDWVWILGWCVYLSMEAILEFQLLMPLIAPKVKLILF